MNGQVKNILFEVVNKDENINFLSKIPYIEMSDLAVFFYFDDTKTVLQKSDIDTSDFTIDEIFKVAKTNMENRYPSKITVKTSRNDEPLFYRITNNSKNGTTSFFTDKTNKTLKTIAKDFYLFFISNKEVICIDPKTFNKEESAVLLNTSITLFSNIQDYSITNKLYEYNPTTQRLTELNINLDKYISSEVSKDEIPLEEQELDI